jgi:hypothetical protein
MKKNIASQLGFWSSVYSAIFGAIYIILLVSSFSTEGPVGQPTPFAQLVIGILIVIYAPVYVIRFAAIHYVNEGDKKVLGSLGICFIMLWAIIVSACRFIHLTMIQQHLPDVPADLKIFYIYSPSGSVTAALIILALVLFSSLAHVFVAPLFSSTRLNKTIRWLCILFTIFSFTSFIGSLTAIPILIGIGFGLGVIAWGPIAFVLVFNFLN